MGNGWHSCFLKARGGCRGGKRERERDVHRQTQTDRHTHASHREGRGREGARGGRERDIPKAALRLRAGTCLGAGSMLVLSPWVWGSYLQLFFCFAFSQTANVGNVFSVSAGKML